MNTSQRISKVFMKVDAPELSTMRSLVLHVLGGREVYTAPGLSVLELNDGGTIELYGPGSAYPAYLFEKENMVLSFSVDNLEEAVAEAVGAGMEKLEGMKKVCSGFSYCHLRDREGHVYGLHQEEHRKSA